MSIQQLLSLIQEEENRNPPPGFRDILDKVFSTAESHGWCEDIDPETSVAMGMLMIGKAVQWMQTDIEENGNTLSAELMDKIYVAYPLFDDLLADLVDEYKAKVIRDADI